MDVLRLDTSSYLPDALIEGYSSMIWTERQSKNGEFELKTTKVSETRSLIPEESLIALLDSREVMFVETHSIGQDSDNSPELTVTGRTFETFLENRLVTTKQTSGSLSTAGISAYLIDSAMINASNALDNVPNLAVTDSTTVADTPKVWTLDPKSVYELLTEFLPLVNLGLRNLRPLNESTDLTLDIFNGLDRTRGQTDREPVIFHYNSGHITDPSYLFSSKDYKNYALVSTTNNGVVEVWPGDNTPPAPIPSGLNRRALLVEGGDITVADAIQKGQVELKKHNRQILFDGAISPVTPYRYNQEYFLGDIVTLAAEYGFEASMLVTEYVRTEDQDGDRGYPTLVLAD